MASGQAGGEGEASSPGTGRRATGNWQRGRKPHLRVELELHDDVLVERLPLADGAVEREHGVDVRRVGPREDVEADEVRVLDLEVRRLAHEAEERGVHLDREVAARGEHGHLVEGGDRVAGGGGGVLHEAIHENLRGRRHLLVSSVGGGGVAVGALREGLGRRREVLGGDGDVEGHLEEGVLLLADDGVVGREFDEEVRLGRLLHAADVAAVDLERRLAVDGKGEAGALDGGLAPVAAGDLAREGGGGSERGRREGGESSVLLCGREQEGLATMAAANRQALLWSGMQGQSRKRVAPTHRHFALLNVRGEVSFDELLDLGQVRLPEAVEARVLPRLRRDKQLCQRGRTTWCTPRSHARSAVLLGNTLSLSDKWFCPLPSRCADQEPFLRAPSVQQQAGSCQECASSSRSQCLRLQQRGGGKQIVSR